MSGIGWRSGTAWGLAAGAVTAWLATPWVSMAVRGTVDSRRSERLRTDPRRPTGADGPVAHPGRLQLVAGDAPVGDHRRGPRSLASVPGQRARAAGRSRATS